MKVRNFAIAVTAATALLLQSGAAHARPAEEDLAVAASDAVIRSTQPVYEFDPVYETPAVETDSLTLEVYDGLLVLENIPDQVIAQGDAATTTYLQGKFGTPGAGQVQAFGIVGCISAIGVAILSIVGPVSKIKAVVKAAGGAWKLAKTLSKAYKAARKAGFSRGDAIRWARNEAVKSVTRADYKNILISLLSAGAVVGECFE